MALTNTFLLGVRRVSGESMLPTLPDRALVLVAQRPVMGTIERFTVVTLQAPFSGEAQIKRVVAFPGETIRIANGVLYIDEHAVVEPHRSILPEHAQQQRFTVPDGHVFVLGDNRSPLASRDSRQYGPVPETDITGRVLLY